MWVLKKTKKPCDTQINLDINRAYTKRVEEQGKRDKMIEKLLSETTTIKEVRG